MTLPLPAFLCSHILKPLDLAVRLDVTQVIFHGRDLIHKEVVLDRPFFYMLIDCETNLPFFSGTIFFEGKSQDKIFVIFQA